MSSETAAAHTVASGTTSDPTGGPDPYATARETTEGRIYTVTGGDWDDFVDESRHDDRIVINMGPQHPSTHGVLRLVLELEGEVVTQARS
ncbi:MAG: NADH dehydrogenase subunit D, partial [Pseudonocardiaceae bacterium]